jgi:hypothetical protein
MGHLNGVAPHDDGAEPDGLQVVAMGASAVLSPALGGSWAGVGLGQALRSLRQAVNWTHDKLPAAPDDPSATRQWSGTAGTPGGKPGKRG